MHFHYQNFIGSPHDTLIDAAFILLGISAVCMIFFLALSDIFLAYTWLETIAWVCYAFVFGSLIFILLCQIGFSIYPDWFHPST
jgi:hypothetical protein